MSDRDRPRCCSAELGISVAENTNTLTFAFRHVSTCPPLPLPRLKDYQRRFDASSSFSPGYGRATQLAVLTQAEKASHNTYTNRRLV